MVDRIFVVSNVHLDEHCVCQALKENLHGKCHSADVLATVGPRVDQNVSTESRVFYIEY